MNSTEIYNNAGTIIFAPSYKDNKLYGAIIDEGCYKEYDYFRYEVTLGNPMLVTVHGGRYREQKDSKVTVKKFNLTTEVVKLLWQFKAIRERAEE